MGLGSDEPSHGLDRAGRGGLSGARQPRQPRPNFRGTWGWVVSEFEYRLGVVLRQAGLCDGCHNQTSTLRHSLAGSG